MFWRGVTCHNCCNKKVFPFFMLLLFATLATNAQEESTYSGYMLYKPLYNPSFSGISTEMNALFMSRIMFANSISIFGIEGPVDISGLKSGLGLMVKSDKIANFEQTDVEAMYAYHRNTKAGKFGLGLTLGFYNFHVSSDWEVPADNYGNYNMISAESDPSIPSEMSNMAFGIGVGAYYETSDYYLGLSVSKLNRAEITTEVESGDGSAFFHYTRELKLMGGYNISLPNPLLDMKPTFILRSDFAAYQLTVSDLMYYKEKYWYGLGIKMSPFTSFDAVTIVLGAELLNGLNVSYLLDVNTSSMIRYGSSAMSHEFVVSYSFNLRTKREQKYKSVRYL